MPEYYEYGHHEPENVPHGKVTLKQVVEFISGHYLDAVKFSIPNIAKNYHLPEETVSKYLHLFVFADLKMNKISDCSFYMYKLFQMGYFYKVF